MERGQGLHSRLDIRALRNCERPALYFLVSDNGQLTNRRHFLSMLSLEDLLFAYEWVSADPARENAAYVDRLTGKVYWNAEECEPDQELPEDIDDDTKYIEVPDKFDLDLGKALVFKFVTEYLKNEHDKVSSIFHGTGAYGRFKDLLESKKLLDTWYEYEQVKIDNALMQWCILNSLQCAPRSGKSSS